MPTRAEKQEEDAKRGLGVKICEIMQSVKYVPKKGVNSFSHYNYATESDVVANLRLEMAKRHIYMNPDLVKYDISDHMKGDNKAGYMFTGLYEFHFVDADTKEEIKFHMIGQGEDSLDKASYKATTGAEKYALMKLFMIPTGDDPEEDNEDEKPEKKAEKRARKKTEDQGNKPEDDIQRAKITNLITEYAGLVKKPNTEIVKVIENMMKVSFTQMTYKQAALVQGQLNTWIAGRKGTANE